METTDLQKIEEPKPPTIAEPTLGGEKPKAKDMIVIARDPEQLDRSQAKLVKHFKDRIHDEKKHLAEVEDNLAAAKKHGWRTKPLASTVSRTKNRIDFYEKCLAALEAGYYIVPDVPMQLFAIRTTAKKPTANFTQSEWSNRQMPREQDTNSPPLGEGKNVSTVAEVSRETVEVKKDDKVIKQAHQVWATDFHEVDFPVRIAQAELMDATADALQKKIFDEIGVAPPMQQRKKPDPMIMGRIKERGPSGKSLTFLIVWFLDTRTL